MTKEKVLELAAHYKTLLPNPQQMPVESYDEVGHPDPDEVYPHAAWMCDRIVEFVAEDHIEKAMRWLGFVQALVWIDGEESLNTMRDMARNDD